MTGIYLDGIMAPSLLEVCQSTGLDVTGWAGWQTRSRSSGGYPAPGPYGVIDHHTASPERSTPGQQFANDASYCAVGHPDAPVAALVLGPEGQVSVHAAGATNHAGKGGPITTSRGTVPVDGGNSRLLAVECCNDGQGQQWPQVQQEALVALNRAWAAAYGFRLDRWGTYSWDILSHEEWCRPSCPGRKCDPAGPSQWSPKAAGGCSAGNLWAMDAFRTSLGQAPEPEPEPEDDMAGFTYKDTRYQNVWLVGQGPATAITTNALQGLNLPKYENTHDQTLSCYCWQAWGVTVDEARAAGLLV